MKKIIKYSIIIFVLSLFMGAISSCNGQPRSDYTVTWNTVADADSFRVFVWEGADPASCPLVQEQDYLNPDVSSLLLKTVAMAGTTINLANNGEYVVVGVVAVDHSVSQTGVYGGLGRSSDVVKSSVPGTPSAINVVLP